MDWKILFSTFLAILMAELGDKTQLAVVAIATSPAAAASRWSVFFGASLALVVACFLGVLLGHVLLRIIPAHYVRYAAALLFIGVGAWMLLSREG